MEQKAFNILKSDENIAKVQVGTDIISLDTEEKNRLLRLLHRVKETLVLFPDGLEGICLVYPDGLIAANISLSKINLSGTRYLLFLYHKTPNSSEFITNTFLITNDIMDMYIETLEQCE